MPKIIFHSCSSVAKQIGRQVFFTIEETAITLHCSTSKISAYIRQGRLKTVRQGLARLISEEDLVALQALPSFQRLLDL